MDKIKYHREIDLTDKNTVYYKILEEIVPNSTILEIGCSTGYLTKILKEKYSSKVFCIEIDEEAANIAKNYCDKIIISDVETLNFEEKFEKNFFDFIILADILEHLKNPENLLENLKPLLKKEGSLLISIPNITHASVALSLLEGKWEYNPIGLLDETHLRFFTKQSFLNLLEEKGFCPLKIKRVIINPYDTEFKTPYYEYPNEIRSFIEKNNPDFNTYQFVIKAIPFNEKTEIIKWKEKLEEVQSEKINLEEKLEEVQSEKINLEEKLEEVQSEKINLEEKLEEVQSEKINLEEKLEEVQSEKINLEEKLEEINSEKENLENKLIILEEENQYLNNKLSFLKENNHQFEQKLKEITNELIILKEHLIEKDFQLTEIYNSLFWKIAVFYRKIIEKILPSGSRRRKFYNLLNIGIKTLSKDGLKKFILKTKKYIKKSNSKNLSLPNFPGFSNKWHQLELPLFDNIKISIIIPVYNKSIYTFNCIKSIKDNSTIPYEVIVIDDCSTDDTGKMIKNIKNCRYYRNKKNQGFIYSCNLGAEKAQGDYLIFLNNDTIVTKDWDKNLLKIFEINNDAGLVGVKLIFPDGKLQEAGSIIFSDGSAWNYGKFDDPTKPEYNYIRKVDYCSGACIAIKKELFHNIGRFEEIYKPAYYEDTDLAMKIRDNGLNVYFQPFSIVYHFEGVTSGKDTSSGVKKYQEINKTKFFEKWNEVLKTNHYTPNTSLFIARERIDKGIILVIDHYVPTYDRDSGSLRMFSILKLLANLGWKVIFWPDNLAKLEPYTSELQWLGIEVIYGNRNFVEYIKENGKFIDYAFLSRPHIAKNYIEDIKIYSDATVIYDTVDLHYLREERRAKIENNPDVFKEAEDWKNIEFYLCRKSDIVIAITENEKNILKKEFPEKKIEVIPNIHTPQKNIKPFEKRKDIMFIGSFIHPPNIDAVLWFANEIFPIIKKELFDIKFYIIGNEPTQEVKKLSNNDIIVTGYVKDVTPYFQNCKVFVSPLRYGAGLKGKIGQSMSFGLPVVTTSIGAEGFIFDDSPFLIADDEITFAESVIKLYQDKELWTKLSKAGMEIIKKYYSPESIEKILNNIFIND